MKQVLGILESVVAFILAVIAALVIYQVVARHVLGGPPSWTEELARYLQVWLVLLASPVCLGRGMHLAIDVLTPRLPPGPRRMARRGVLVLVGFFSLLLIVYGVNLLGVAAFQTSPALGVSMVWPYLAMPVSGILMLLVTADLILKEKRGRSPESKGRP